MRDNLKFRCRLHELFHPGMSFIPRWLASHPGMTFNSVSGHLPVSVYMIWSKNVFVPGWFHPCLQHRGKIIPGRTHFCSKSCKHLQVNDQTQRWKSSRDEMQVIPGWNNSCKRRLRLSLFITIHPVTAQLWRSEKSFVLYLCYRV